MEIATAFSSILEMHLMDCFPIFISSRPMVLLTPLPIHYFLLCRHLLLLLTTSFFLDKFMEPRALFSILPLHHHHFFVLQILSLLSKILLALVLSAPIAYPLSCTPLHIMSSALHTQVGVEQKQELFPLCSRALMPHMEPRQPKFLFG